MQSTEQQCTVCCALLHLSGGCSEGPMLPASKVPCTNSTFIQEQMSFRKTIVIANVHWALTASCWPLGCPLPMDDFKSWGQLFWVEISIVRGRSRGPEGLIPCPASSSAGKSASFKNYVLLAFTQTPLANCTSEECTVLQCLVLEWKNLNPKRSDLS